MVGGIIVNLDPKIWTFLVPSTSKVPSTFLT